MKKLFIALLFALATGATASAQYTTVRTNVLGLATGTVNVGVDVAVADKWSVDVSGYWNLISTERLQFNVLVGTVAVRRWRFEPHVGLFYGIHATAAKYKVGNTGRRYYGWTGGAGASVGYCWMLSRRWNFSLEGGLGVFYMRDTLWHPDSSSLEDILLRHCKRVLLAPSKIEVAFSYLF